MSDLIKLVLNYIEEKKIKLTGSIVVNSNGTLISSNNKRKIRNDLKSINPESLAIPSIKKNIQRS